MFRTSSRRPQLDRSGRVNHSDTSCSARSSAAVSARRRRAPDPLAPFASRPLALLARDTARARGRGRLELGPRRSPRARTDRSSIAPRLLPQRLPGERGAREELAAGPQRRPSSTASSRARSASPSDSRAHASAVSRRLRARRSSAATLSTAGASNRTSWQRERIVGSTSPSRSVSRIRCTNDGGSSSVFSIRLAASSPSSSARSITNTRRADSNGVLLAADTTGPSMSLTRISCAPLGRPRSDPGATRTARALARCPDRASPPPAAGRDLARRRPLAGAARTVEQVGVRWRVRPAPTPARARRGRVDDDRARPARAPMLASAPGMPTRGRLITIEGLDGAGKTTRRDGAVAALTDRGIDARLLREPGGVPAAERSARSSRTRPRGSAPAPRRCCTQPRARSSSRRHSSRCSRPARGLCSTGSSTPRSHTRAAAGARVEAVSEINVFATGAWRRIALCC